MMDSVIDFHTHILPKVDDGSKSIKESLAMLRQEAEQGIGHVVATPHFYPRYDSPEEFLARRAESEHRLREAMAGQEDLPALTVGAEVHYFPGISESDILQEMTIGQSGYVLIEMPQSPWKDTMYRELEGIRAKQGLIPVVAHIDRYIAPFRTQRIPERLEELPVLVQANASFFLDRATSRMAMRLLRQDRIQLLGSDCHNLTGRAPNLGAAVRQIEKRLGGAVLEQIRSYQNEILADEPSNR